MKIALMVRYGLFATQIVFLTSVGGCLGGQKGERPSEPGRTPLKDQEGQEGTAQEAERNYLRKAEEAKQAESAVTSAQAIAEQEVANAGAGKLAAEAKETQAKAIISVPDRAKAYGEALKAAEAAASAARAALNAVRTTVKKAEDYHAAAILAEANASKANQSAAQATVAAAKSLMSKAQTSYAAAVSALAAADRWEMTVAKDEAAAREAEAARQAQAKGQASLIQYHLEVVEHRLSVAIPILISDYERLLGRDGKIDGYPLDVASAEASPPRRLFRALKEKMTPQEFEQKAEPHFKRFGELRAKVAAHLNESFRKQAEFQKLDQATITLDQAKKYATELDALLRAAHNRYTEMASVFGIELLNLGSKVLPSIGRYF